MDNIIDIELTGRSTRRDQKLWQYDYGQVLRIAGKDFPKVTEVQFSLRQSGGHTLDRIGTSNNGLLTVQIPNELLQNKGATSDYTIYAFVYLTGDGCGNTKYMIQLPVESRPEPTDPSEDPSIDPSIFEDAINAVNASADRAEAAEKSAKESADKAKEYAESAGKSKGDVEEARDNAISAIGTEKESSLRGIESKTVESLQKIHSQTEESQNSIKQSIADATQKKTELDGAISNATDAKGNLDKAVQSAGNAKAELDTSVGKAGEAKMALGSSINSAGEKQLALDTTVEQANTVDASLKEHIGSAEQIQANVEQIAKNKADISSLNEDLGEKETVLTDIQKKMSDSSSKDGFLLCDLNGNIVGHIASFEVWNNEPYNKKYGWGGHPYGNRKLPPYSKIVGILESDLLSVRGGKGRWNKDDTGNFQHGGHLFEGWNAEEDARLTFGIGTKNKDISWIQTFHAATQEGTDSGAYYCVTKVGSDIDNQGMNFMPTITQSRSLFSLKVGVDLAPNSKHIQKLVETGELVDWEYNKTDMIPYGTMYFDYTKDKVRVYTRTGGWKYLKFEEEV